jgi:hypothetical protein
MVARDAAALAGANQRYQRLSGQVAASGMRYLTNRRNRRRIGRFARNLTAIDHANEAMNFGNGQRLYANPRGSGAASDGVVTAAATAIGNTMVQSYGRGLHSQVISHSEFVGDVKGSVGFNINTFRINGADAITFPWLSRLATNFEFYRFLSLRAYYKTQTATTTTGSLMLAYEYDVADAPPQDKSALLVFEGAVRSPPWQNTVCELSKRDVRGNKWYIAPSAALSDTEKRQQDVALLHVATEGQSSGNVIGELWVEYQCELITPQPPLQYAGEYAEYTWDNFPNPPLVQTLENYSVAPIWRIDPDNGGTIIFNRSGSFAFVIRSQLTSPQTQSTFGAPVPELQFELDGDSIITYPNHNIIDDVSYAVVAGVSFFALTAEAGQRLSIRWTDTLITTTALVIYAVQTTAGAAALVYPFQ